MGYVDEAIFTVFEHPQVPEGTNPERVVCFHGPLLIKIK